MANEKQRAILEQRIIKKAWEDEDFKKLLLENPRAALEKELEIEIPEEVEIKVVEETLNTLYLVLPVDPAKVESVRTDVESRGYEVATYVPSAVVIK